MRTPQGKFCKSEVADLRIAFGIQNQILGLQVSVQDMPGVQMFQTPGCTSYMKPDQFVFAPEQLLRVDVPQLASQHSFHEKFDAGTQVVERSATHEEIAVRHPHDVLLVEHTLLALRRINLGLVQGLQCKERMRRHMLHQIHRAKGAGAQAFQDDQVGTSIGRSPLLFPNARAFFSPHLLHTQEDFLAQHQDCALGRSAHGGRSRRVVQQGLLAEVGVKPTVRIGMIFTHRFAVHTDMKTSFEQHVELGGHLSLRDDGLASLKLHLHQTAGNLAAFVGREKLQVRDVFQYLGPSVKLGLKSRLRHLLEVRCTQRP
mmetsp:Transcript_2245/g.3871  ORF Transcript_2245/g.3871 Transcript_2245/m.3871 type:complete len:315 (+) Transcript_2245:524-1468(+)